MDTTHCHKLLVRWKLSRLTQVLNLLLLCLPNDYMIALIVMIYDFSIKQNVKVLLRRIIYLKKLLLKSDWSRFPFLSLQTHLRNLLKCQTICCILKYAVFLLRHTDESLFSQLYCSISIYSIAESTVNN